VGVVLKNPTATGIVVPITLALVTALLRVVARPGPADITDLELSSDLSIGALGTQLSFLAGYYGQSTVEATPELQRKIDLGNGVLFAIVILGFCITFLMQQWGYSSLTNPPHMPNMFGLTVPNFLAVLACVVVYFVNVPGSSLPGTS
jgi:hypothetical protein